METSCQGLCSVGRTHTSGWAKAPGRRAPATQCHGPGGHSKSQSLEWDAEWPFSQNKPEGAEAASASCHTGMCDCDESCSSMFPVCVPCVCALRMLLFHLKRKGRFLSCEAFSLSRFRKPQSLNHAVPQRQTGNGSCRPGTGLVAGQNEALWQVAEICLSNCKCISLWPIKLECILESL